MATGLGSLIGRRLRQRRRSFVRDERGVTIIEFAILALPFFSIVGAILETSVVFLSGQLLESAVQDVSRLIRTGQAQGTIVTDEDFRQRVCARLYGMFTDCDGLYVEVRAITNFAAASISAPVDRSCEEACTGWTRDDYYTPGASSSFMMVQVYYKWPVILDLFDMTVANLPDSKRLLGVASVFRNEPY